jgi:hypothetical protein
MIMLSESHVMTAWDVLRLWMEEMSSKYGGVAAGMLNKQSLAADKGWYSSLRVGHRADNSSS